MTASGAEDKLAAYRFNFGMANSIVDSSRGDELWVYVQRNAKYVTIERDGFASVRKYDLNTTIMPGRTYVMTLSADAQKILRQMVRFNIEPKGIQASVSIRRDGGKGQEELLGFVDPTMGALAKLLELGSYFYVVRSPDYYDSDGMLTLNDQRQLHIENVRLRGQFGNVTLRVSQNADIYVDDEKKGTREWTGNLRAGNHVVECRQANHKSSQQYISVNEGESKTFDLTPPTPITGLLSLISTPLDADISIDGKSYGKTPNMIPDLLIGTHALTLSKSDYQNSSQQVKNKEKKTIEQIIMENKKL